MAAGACGRSVLALDSMPASLRGAKIPSLALILHTLDGTKTLAELQVVIEAAIQTGELQAP